MLKSTSVLHASIKIFIQIESINPINIYSFKEGRNTTKQITEKEIIELIEKVRTHLNENPLKGWAYLHYKVTDAQKAVLQLVWPRLQTWQADAKKLQQGQEDFEFKIEKQLNEVRRTELKKLCKELFG